ncbi:hypothetical protein SARC_08365, partial [Sphaeroforma arctica JP610]
MNQNRTQEPSTMSQSTAVSAQLSKTFKYVKIPADEKEPCEELSMTYTDATEIQCLTEKLQNYYRERKGAADSAAEREAFKKQMEEKLAERAEKGGPPGPKITDELMDQLTNMQTVDICTLLTPNAENDYEMICAYVDDKSVAKQLPINRRAQAVAFSAMQKLELRGDVFFAKLYENGVEDKFGRMDFVLNDLMPEASWVQAAQKFTS